MKQEIHPTYYPRAKVRCACGNTFTVGATREQMTVEICSKCHPFYTGTEKLIDIAGRVEKFRTRQEKAKTAKIVKPKVMTRQKLPGARVEATRMNKKMRGSLHKPQKGAVKKKAKK